MVVSTRCVALGCGALILVGAVVGACGQKGPPLAPFIRIPAAVEDMSVRRIGHDVYVSLVLPAENIDASTPVVIDRVEVLAYTGTVAPAPGRWGELGTRIANLSIESADAPLLSPGGNLTLVDHLSTADRSASPLPPTAASPAATTTDVAPRAPLRRFYTALAFDARGRPSPPGVVGVAPLEELNTPVAALTATYTETAVRLAWQAFDVGIGPAAVPIDASAEAPVPTVPVVRYNVYGVTRGSPPVDTDVEVVPPLALNPEPLVAPEFDGAVEFGVERCFLVRAVSTSGAVESLASAPACVTPIDRFPPAVPSGLIANATANGVSLIWNANEEPDLDGYLVLRSSSAEVAPQPVTPTPIQGARFLDVTAATGVQYRYTVVAVDRQVPDPNRSEPSETVTAIGR